jgi:excisionase family DNA binding protein
MNTQPITFETMPSAIGRLLAKVEELQRRLDAASAPPPPQTEYVTILEAQEILRGTVTVQTLYNWKYKGRIATTKVGRKLLFKRSDVEAMLKGNYTPTAAEADAAIEAEANAILCQSVKRNNGRP